MSSRESETLDLRHVGEVAAVIARNAEQLLSSRECLRSQAMTTYWDASRKRADLWQYALDDALDASRRDQPLGKHAVRSATTVIGEVLATELVTRLWTSVIVGHESRHGQNQEVLARRVLSDHLTARRSALRLLTHPIALPTSEIVALDRIRQRAERWSDCLLSTLPPECSALEFAFDLSRFQEFSEDAEIVTRLSSRLNGWHLLALSLRVASGEGPAADQTRNQLHRDILDSIGSVIEQTGRETKESVAELDGKRNAANTTATEIDIVAESSRGDREDRELESVKPTDQEEVGTSAHARSHQDDENTLSVAGPDEIQEVAADEGSDETWSSSLPAAEQIMSNRFGDDRIAGPEFDSTPGEPSVVAGRIDRESDAAEKVVRMVQGTLFHRLQFRQIGDSTASCDQHKEQPKRKPSRAGQVAAVPLIDGGLQFRSLRVVER